MLNFIIRPILSRSFIILETLVRAIARLFPARPPFSSIGLKPNSWPAVNRPSVQGIRAAKMQKGNHTMATEVVVDRYNFERHFNSFTT